jgi:hypothetical protein
LQQSAGARERDLARRERVLKRNKEKVEQSRAELVEEKAALRKDKHGARLKKLTALSAKWQRKAEKWEASYWATFQVFVEEEEHYSELEEIHRSGFDCRWTREEMNLWGKPKHPYPYQIFRMGMLLCQHEAPCSQMPFFISEVLACFFPELANMRTPSSETCRNWRLGLLVASDLVSAIKMSTSKTLTLGHDGTGKGHLKFGITVVSTESGAVMPNGVYTQETGEAGETGELVFHAAFEKPQATYDSFRAMLKKNNQVKGIRISPRLANRNSQQRVCEEVEIEEKEKLEDYLPEMSLLDRVVEGKVSAALMSDHAAAALLTSTVIENKLITEAAARGEEDNFKGVVKVQCSAHKMKGLVDGGTRGQQQWLANEFKDLEHDPYEYATGSIISQFYRMGCKEFSIRSGYEFGQAAEYRRWMHEHWPGRLRSRPSERGTHYYWNAEMSSLAIFTFDNDLEFMLFLFRSKKEPLNKLEEQLLHMLGCVEIKSAIKAESLFWWWIVKPVELLVDSDELGLFMKHMNPFFLRVADLLKG